MLVIKLTRARPQEDPVDPLERRYYGWDPERSTEENWQANRGYWALGTQADNQDHVLFVHDEFVVMAAQITGIVSAGPAHPGRRILEGRPLRPSDPVYETYVGRRAPEKTLRARNPVTYHDDRTPGFGHRCRCGCGTEVYNAQFVTGHDQVALHQRVAKIGTIGEFIDWFDAIHTGTTPPTTAFSPQGEGSDAERILAEIRRLVCG